MATHTPPRAISPDSCQPYHPGPGLLFLLPSLWQELLKIDHPSETRVHYSYPLTATNQLPHSLLYVNFIFVLLVISVYAWLLMSHGDQGGLFLVSSAFYSCY